MKNKYYAEGRFQNQINSVALAENLLSILGEVAISDRDKKNFTLIMNLLICSFKDNLTKDPMARAPKSNIENLLGLLILSHYLNTRPGFKSNPAFQRFFCDLRFAMGFPNLKAEEGNDFDPNKFNDEYANKCHTYIELKDIFERINENLSRENCKIDELIKYQTEFYNLHNKFDLDQVKIGQLYLYSETKLPQLCEEKRLYEWLNADEKILEDMKTAPARFEKVEQILGKIEDILKFPHWKKTKFLQFGKPTAVDDLLRKISKMKAENRHPHEILSTLLQDLEEKKKKDSSFSKSNPVAREFYKMLHHQLIAYKQADCSKQIQTLEAFDKKLDGFSSALKMQDRSVLRSSQKFKSALEVTSDLQDLGNIDVEDMSMKK